MGVVRLEADPRSVGSSPRWRERDLVAEADVRAAGWAFGLAALWPLYLGISGIVGHSGFGGRGPGVTGGLVLAGLGSLLLLAGIAYFARFRGSRWVAAPALVASFAAGLLFFPLLVPSILLATASALASNARRAEVLGPAYQEVMWRHSEQRPRFFASGISWIPILIGLGDLLVLWLFLLLANAL